MTILYNAKKWLGYSVIFKGKGSVLFQPRTIFSACVSGMVAGICSLQRIEGYLTEAVGDPNIFFSAISFLLGFVLVYRAQEAYSRYWNASIEVQSMFSHLRSLAVMMRTWTPSVAVQLRFLTRLRVFAIIACDLLKAKPSDYDFLLTSKLLSPEEALLIIGKRNRAGICVSWLADIIAVFICATHKVGTECPLRARTHVPMHTASLRTIANVIVVCSPKFDDHVVNVHACSVWFFWQVPKLERHSRVRKEISRPGRGHSFARQPEKIASFVMDPQLGILYQELNAARYAYEQAKLVADIPYPFPCVCACVCACARMRGRLLESSFVFWRTVRG